MAHIILIYMYHELKKNLYSEDKYEIKADITNMRFDVITGHLNSISVNSVSVQSVTKEEITKLSLQRMSWLFYFCVEKHRCTCDKSDIERRETIGRLRSINYNMINHIAC